MKIIGKFDKWQMINEQEALNVDAKLDPKEARKAKRLARKKDRRKFRKEDYISDSGATYTLIRQKDSDDTQDTFVLKGKGKDSPVWDEKGVVVDDVKDFLDSELFSGENEGKYDEESIEMEKYREGKRRDRVKFTIKLIDQEKVKAEEEAKKKEEEEAKKKAEAEKAAKAITIPKNAEGENRIEIGQTSEVLPKIKEMIRKTFVKKGFKMGSSYGMDWLDSDKLEEKDAVWVKALRAGFGMPIKDFISQGLVDKLVAQVAEWEKPAEEENKDQASNESWIPTFESYMIILEQFDMEAAMKQMEAAPKPEKKKEATKKSSGGGKVSTGLNDDQAKQYRAWANTPAFVKIYGKQSKFDLDEKGTNNSFVKRSFAQAKKDYEGATGPFKSPMNFNVKVGVAILKKFLGHKSDTKSTGSSYRRSMEADYKLAASISDKLAKFWTGSERDSTFKPYKGFWDDSEYKALKGAYEPWLKSSGINGMLAKIKNPYYKKTMEGVIAKTKEEMTDTVSNSISWVLLNPSKLKDVPDEGLKQLAQYEPLPDTWLGSDWNELTNRFQKAIGYKPEMSKWNIGGTYLDF